MLECKYTVKEMSTGFVRMFLSFLLAVLSLGLIFGAIAAVVALAIFYPGYLLALALLAATFNVSRFFYAALFEE